MSKQLSYFFIFISIVLVYSCTKTSMSSHVDYSALPDTSAGTYYGHSSWSAPHRDGRNSDDTPSITVDVKYAWNQLPGTSMFMGPTIGIQGEIYATTGQGIGHSHLHAFDRSGELLWQSVPTKTLEDLDYGAKLSATLIDVDGNIYIPDMNQIWSFNSDGNVRWVISTRELGIEGVFFSLIVTHQGYVAGVSSDAKLIYLNRSTGALIWKPFSIPGNKGLSSLAVPEGFGADGFIAEEFIQLSWDAIFGQNMVVANTPSIHPETGRIFVTANGIQPNTGTVIGIDTTLNGPKISFISEVPSSGSGTSPTISYDGKYVYSTDGEGKFLGIDTTTGNIAWKSSESSISAVSPTAAYDGNMYTFNYNHLISWDGSNGNIRWRYDLTHLVEEELSWFQKKYGRPYASFNSAITATPTRLWVSAVVATAIDIPEERQIDMPIDGYDKTIYPQPIKYFLLAFDYEGNLLQKLEVPNGLDSIMTADVDGRIFSGSYSILDTIGYYSADPKMPFFLRNTPKPIGGLFAFEPVSYLEHTYETFRWIELRLLPMVKESVLKGNIKLAEKQLKDGVYQLSGVLISLEQSLLKKETPQNTFEEISISIKGIQEQMQLAINEGLTSVNLMDEFTQIIQAIYSSLPPQ